MDVHLVLIGSLLSSGSIGSTMSDRSRSPPRYPNGCAPPDGLPIGELPLLPYPTKHDQCRCLCSACVHRPLFRPPRCILRKGQGGINDAQFENPKFGHKTIFKNKTTRSYCELQPRPRQDTVSATCAPDASSLSGMAKTNQYETFWFNDSRPSMMDIPEAAAPREVLRHLACMI